jgi:transmembrane sensor
MTKDEIRQLAERVALGIATDKEIQLYDQVYNAFLSKTELEWDEELYGNKQALQAEIRRSIHEKAGITNNHRKINWIRWAAAAAVVGVIAATSFLLNSSKSSIPVAKKLETQNERFKNDVAPGQNGAVLTLSNGKTIVLDSAGNGALAEENGTEIHKKDGQITYTGQAGKAETLYNTMTTPRGRQFKLVLADGSNVWLNAESSITYPTVFTGKERKVSITGEAYFEIAHNAAMPFVVEKGEMRVHVLGTHFNINSYEDESSINVTLLEGSLEVSKNNLSRLVKPGQQAQLQTGGIHLVDDADIAKVMAWKNGFFDFGGTDVGALMRQLARWYDVEVVYDRKINDLFFATIPRNTNLSDVLKALELTGKVKFEIAGRTIRVKP